MESLKAVALMQHFSGWAFVDFEGHSHCAGPLIVVSTISMTHHMHTCFNNIQLSVSLNVMCNSLKIEDGQFHVYKLTMRCTTVSPEMMWKNLQMMLWLVPYHSLWRTAWWMNNISESVQYLLTMSATVWTWLTYNRVSPSSPGKTIRETLSLPQWI